MDGITIQDTSEIVEQIFNNWDIGSWVKDGAVVQDIKSAIEEAYMKGCIHSRLDDDLFMEALKYIK